MENPIMNSFNKKMLEDVIENFNAVYSFYKKSAEDISHCSTIVDQMSDLQQLIHDVEAVKSMLGKKVLHNEILSKLNEVFTLMKMMKNAFDSIGKKFDEHQIKMPLSQTDVKKIMKKYNFYDLDDNSNQQTYNLQKTTNLDFQHINHAMNRKAFTPVAKDDIQSRLISMPAIDNDVPPTTVNMLKDMGFQPIDGIDMVSSDLEEDNIDELDEADVKPITIEQFENVVDDTKNLVEDLKKKSENDVVHGVDDSKTKTKKKRAARQKKSK